MILIEHIKWVSLDRVRRDLLSPIVQVHLRSIDSCHLKAFLPHELFLDGSFVKENRNQGRGLPPRPAQGMRAGS